MYEYVHISKYTISFKKLTIIFYNNNKLRDVSVHYHYTYCTIDNT